MKNNITETYCSFEVSKLLESLGFESNESKMRFDSSGYSFQKADYNFWSEKFRDSIERPTHSLAFNWIAENFGYWISLERDMEGNFFAKINIISEETWQNESLRDVRYEVICIVNKKPYFYKSYQQAADETLLPLLQKLLEIKKPKENETKN
jgi:hypothetical protein